MPKFKLYLQCKPEQVQAVQEAGTGEERLKRDQLIYRVGDIITVLDKRLVSLLVD